MLTFGARVIYQVKPSTREHLGQFGTSSRRCTQNNFTRIPNTAVPNCSLMFRRATAAARAEFKFCPQNGVT